MLRSIENSDDIATEKFGYLMVEEVYAEIPQHLRAQVEQLVQDD